MCRSEPHTGSIFWWASSRVHGLPHPYDGPKLSLVGDFPFMVQPVAAGGAVRVADAQGEGKMYDCSPSFDGINVIRGAFGGNRFIIHNVNQYMTKKYIYEH